MTTQAPTAEFASFVYGPDAVGLDDPAEAFHEASRLYPNVAPGRLATLLSLAASPELEQTVSRSSRTHEHRPAIELPRSALPSQPLGEVLEARRSTLARDRAPLRLGDLAALLHASYSASPAAAGGSRRPVPSAGALYPLELYVIALDVADLEPCISHYNPFRNTLEVLASADHGQVRSALVDPALVDGASAFVVITALFWRSRFKYGLRGYRFALLEAGHVVQNAVLAASSLGLEALPLGGFYDRRVDSLVGADGLDEASVYAFLLGGRE